MTENSSKPSNGFSFYHAKSEAQVRGNYDKQGFMAHIGAALDKVLPGAVDILLPYSDKVDQQHGYFHGGVIATIADVASGVAAQTLMEEGATVLTTEFKINFVAPATGQHLIARGRVIKPGRTLTVCQSDVYANKDGEEKLVATALLTMICVPASRNEEKNHVAK